jgi:septal ring factor EnvC (AmiA/AmiB activator)
MTSISAVSGSGATSNANVASQITALRKQESVLTQKLKDVATSTGDEKTKKSQSDLLNAQIQVIEVQIARLEQQQAADAAQKADAAVKAFEAAKASTATRASASANAQRSLDGAGTTIDLEA